MIGSVGSPQSNDSLSKYPDGSIQKHLLYSPAITTATSSTSTAMTVNSAHNLDFRLDSQFEMKRHEKEVELFSVEICHPNEPKSLQRSKTEGSMTTSIRNRMPSYVRPIEIEIEDEDEGDSTTTTKTVTTTLVPTNHLVSKENMTIELQQHQQSQLEQLEQLEQRNLSLEELLGLTSSDDE